MPTNVDQFNLEVERLSLEVTEKQLPAIVKKISIDAFNRIVLKTPVDTGRARSGWHVSVDAPSEVVFQDIRSPQQVTNEGAEIILGARNFETIYITNNVNYIGALEEGTSRQAPLGMVAVTVQEINAALR